MTPVPTILTPEEVYALTHRTQPAAQVRWLTHAGWKFARDSDGHPIVAREEFLRNMTGTSQSQVSAMADHEPFEVNLVALQKLRGQA